jgi:hypothetical protein
MVLTSAKDSAQMTALNARSGPLRRRIHGCRRADVPGLRGSDGDRRPESGAGKPTDPGTFIDLRPARVVAGATGEPEPGLGARRQARQLRPGARRPQLSSSARNTLVVAIPARSGPSPRLSSSPTTRPVQDPGQERPLPAHDHDDHPAFQVL